MTAREPSHSAPDNDAPGLPPKLLDQMGDDIDAKKNGLMAIFSPSMWAEKRAILIAAAACLVILIAIVAVVAGLTGTRSVDHDATSEETSLAKAGRGGVGPAGQIRLPQPRITVPLPQPDANDAERRNMIARKRSVALLEKAFSEEIVNGENGLKPYITKAGLAMIDPVFSFSDDELKTLTPDERSQVMAYYEMFSQLGRNLGSKSNEGADISYLASASERLSEQVGAQSPMVISRLVLCRNVTGFGKYELFSDSEFHVRHLPLVQVYLEVDNLKSEPGMDNQHVTRIAKSIRLIRQSASGEEVVMQTALSATEVSHSKQRDFYASHYLHPPRELEPGDYLLEVRIDDKISGETSTQSVPLTIIDD